ncbi:MAG TPA: BON domain-containing protein, partial [Terriglobales bacterium]|nr:BON domain-containing protein [Terriglobales bacterium]
MKPRGSVYLALIALIAVFSLTVACNKAGNDAQIQSEVQSKFSQDSGLQGKQLTVQSANGVVTLSGTVDNQIERDAAGRQAGAVPGVKEVINNLQVGAPAVAQTDQPAEPEQQPVAATPRSSSKPHAARKHRASSSSSSDDVTTTTLTSSTPATTAYNTAPSAPAAPVAPPPPQKVTIPPGTTMAIRLVDSLDSETAQQGQTFHATLDSPLAVDGDTAIPAGYDVEGHVVEVKSAGKFAGQSVLALQLDRISVAGKYYNIQTDQYRKQGSSRGKNTAEKVGAGAGIGAIIGAIAGGGKGAAIGAAAGGGLGGGVQAATRGQQIKLPTET